MVSSSFPGKEVLHMDIGIIGSADGPTAVLVSGSRFSPALAVGICVVAIAVAATAVVLIKRYRKK